MASTEEDLLRKAVLIPCESKESLRNWIRFYLDLDFPDKVVDSESTTSPLDALWELYDALRKNNRPDMQRVMWYAARASYKTLAATALEVLTMLHLRRTVGHLAAIESQALNSQRYVKAAFRRPYLRDYLSGDNVEKVVVHWYEHIETHETITAKEFEELVPELASKFKSHEYYTQIVICTVRGANSFHCNLMCVDGDTEILVKVDPRERQSAAGRQRCVKTARGVFRRLQGRPHGGRLPVVEDEEQTLKPVNQIEVLSMNMVTGNLEFQPILAGIKLFKSRLRVEWEGGSLVCTPDHPIYIHGKGFVQASSLVLGDRVLDIGKLQLGGGVASLGSAGHLSPEPVRDTDEWEQVLLGGLLGDMGIYKRLHNNPYLKEQHCLQQADYLAWKRSILSRKLRVRDLKNPRSGYTQEVQVGFASGNSQLLLPWAGFKKTLAGVERLGPLGLAVWFQDDGCKANGLRFSSESFTKEQNERLRDVLAANFGIRVEVREFSRGPRIYYYLSGDVGAKRRLVEICKPYIHSTMAYKFDLEGNQGQCVHCGSTFWFYEQGTASDTCSNVVCKRLRDGMALKLVTSITPLEPGWVYDFTVKGNHNFFAGRVLNHNCVDEVDIAPPIPYEEAKHIPDEYDGLLPVTLLISTRKSRFGIVQKEIDEAERSGLYVKHWNIFDITRACPPERHEPQKPKVPLYVSKYSLDHKTEADFELLAPEKREEYVKTEGFAGCAKCPLFFGCRGALTKQTSDSKFLKSIPFVISKFREVSRSSAKAQMLCWLPDTEGLIYPHLDREVHVLTASQMAEMMTGEPHPEVGSKSELIAFMKTLEGKFVAGIDHGFSHFFAVSSMFVTGKCGYVFDVQGGSELELEQKVALCKSTIAHWDPEIFADPEQPDANKTLKRKGFKVRAWDKGKGSVMAGIDAVRTKLRPSVGPPELYFLKGDPMIEFLIGCLMKYHWKVDAAGRPTAEPDKVDDDFPDSLRYAVMNEFGSKGRVVADHQINKPELIPVHNEPTSKNYLQHFINQALGESTDDLTDEPVAVEGTKGRQGGFLWDI